jgi:quercetin dioxygenase-like cupin family protein
MSKNGMVVQPGQEVVWQMEPDRTATFKLLSEQTGDSVAIFEELIPAGFGTALHLHHTSDEAMCVLSGDFSFKIGDSVSRGSAGTWAFMPRETAHAWKNSGAKAGRALFMFTPADAHSPQRPTGVIAELSEIARAEVGQFMMLPIAPYVLHRVEVPERRRANIRA